MTPDDALKKLMDGNERYANGAMERPNQSAERRAELIGGQEPFAIVLGCSDSRVPPEIIFDAGLGDLFVIRVAGNIADRVELGSIEYAAVHLHAPLLMVLGHSQCGAVGAVVNGTKLDGNLPSIADEIRPAADKARDLSGDPVDSAAKENARLTAKGIARRSILLKDLADEGELKIVPAFYDLTTGRIEVLS
jgi:carbonic anhydrase